MESSQLSYAASHRAENFAAAFEERGVVVRVRQPPRVAEGDRVELSSGEPGLDAQQTIAVLVIEAYFGERFRWQRASPGTGAQTTVSAEAPQAELVRHRTEFRSEIEQTKFAARGRVRTADGREISFGVEYQLERTFESVTTRAVGAANGKATDPLVVNFGGVPARLTDSRISFDLDGDREPEQIPVLARGSGFLVLDANGNGRADDGRELLGPATGNGFTELAAHDVDGNGWIDESDPVFAKLKVWSQDGLYSLAERGIGAIATAAIETPFELKDGRNQLLGLVRRSGVFLTESGSPGTVQQIDLVG